MGSRFTTPSEECKFAIVNESGLYALVFRSKLPSAVKFKRWVTKEVLPQSEKQGSIKYLKTQWMRFG